MPTEIQNPVATRALVEQFDIKGRFRMLLDEMVAPVVIVGDVRPTTVGGASYQRHRTAAAVAAELAAVLIVGGFLPRFPFTTVLHYARFRAAADDTIRMISNNGSAFVLTGPQDVQGVNMLDSTRPISPVVATVGTIAAAAVAGTITQTIRLPAGEDVLVDLEGWELPPGPQVLGQFARLCFFGTTLNNAVNVSLTFSVRNDE